MKRHLPDNKNRFRLILFVVFVGMSLTIAGFVYESCQPLTVDINEDHIKAMHTQSVDSLVTQVLNNVQLQDWAAGQTRHGVMVASVCENGECRPTDIVISMTRARFLRCDDSGQFIEIVIRLEEEQTEVSSSVAVVRRIYDTTLVSYPIFRNHLSTRQVVNRANSLVAEQFSINQATYQQEIFYTIYADGSWKARVLYNVPGDSPTEYLVELASGEPPQLVEQP